MHVNRKSTFVRCPVREISSDPVFAGFCTGLFRTVYIILNQDKKTPPRRAANIKPDGPWRIRRTVPGRRSGNCGLIPNQIVAESAGRVKGEDCDFTTPAVCPAGPSIERFLFSAIAPGKPVNVRRLFFILPADAVRNRKTGTAAVWLPYPYIFNPSC